MKHYISYLKWILITAYLFLIFIYLKKIVQPELYYHSQQPAFYSNWAFFKEFYNYPGGIAQYLANFLSQFFFIGWTGSLVILGIGILMMISGFNIFRSLKKSTNNYFWMFIPFILLIALLNDYNFPFVVIVKILIVFLALWLFVFLLGKKTHPVVALLLIPPVVYYFNGSGYLFIYTVTSILIFPFKSDSVKKSILFLILASVYNFLIDFISFKYIFGIGPYDAYLSFLHDDLFVYLFYVPVFLFYAFCFSLPFICLLFFLKYKILDNLIKINWDIFNKPLFSNTLITRSLLTVLIACISYFIIHSSIDLHKKNIILTDYYCYNEKWADVINVASSDPKYDMLINYNFNRAIDNSGQFLDLFFGYPQYMGSNAFYPDKENTHGLALISSDYYFDLGYIKESDHWASEALIMHPYSLRILERLVLTNLIFGNYEGANKYLNVLDDNFLAKDFVKKYKAYIIDTTLIARDNLIMEKRSFMPDTTYTIDFLVDRFNFLIKKNDQNRRAYEHKQIFYLLGNKLELFMRNLKESCKFYTHTPEVYEQANLLYIITTKGKDITQYDVSLNSQKNFIEFLKILKENNNNKNLARPFLSQYKNSYIYYVFYNSPTVTKIKLAKEKVLIDALN